MSSWDTRSSSVAFTGYGNVLGRFHGGAFHANWSTLSGESSAQFGFHYENIRITEGASLQQGFGAGGVLLTMFPGKTHGNGVPKAALALYGGAAPTALLRGYQNDLTFPLVFGIGVPLSPSAGVTLTPWVEGSPSLNLQTVYDEYTFDNRPVGEIVSSHPVTGEATIGAGRAQEFAEGSARYESTFNVGLRGGLAGCIRLGDAVSLGLNASVGSLGEGFFETLFVHLGGGLVLSWGARPGASEGATGTAPPYPYAPAHPYAPYVQPAYQPAPYAPGVAQPVPVAPPAEPAGPSMQPAPVQPVPVQPAPTPAPDAVSPPGAAPPPALPSPTTAPSPTTMPPPVPPSTGPPRAAAPTQPAQVPTALPAATPAEPKAGGA